MSDKKTFLPVGEMSPEVFRNHRQDHHGPVSQGFDHAQDHREREAELDHIHAERVVPVAEIIQEKANWHPAELPASNWMYLPDYLRHVRDQHPREYGTVHEHDQHHMAEPDIFDHQHKAPPELGKRKPKPDAKPLRLDHGEQSVHAKLTDAIVLECRRRYAAGERVVALAREFGVSHGTLSSAIHGDSWRHLANPVIYMDPWRRLPPEADDA